MVRRHNCSKSRSQAAGLRSATAMAILNANYMMKRLEPYYPVFFKCVGWCAGMASSAAGAPTAAWRTSSSSTPAPLTTCTLAASTLPSGCRLEPHCMRCAALSACQDYGFHGPTMSWPVPNSLMIEPTESESKAELDRFCDALIACVAVCACTVCETDVQHPGGDQGGAGRQVPAGQQRAQERPAHAAGSSTPSATRRSHPPRSLPATSGTIPTAVTRLRSRSRGSARPSCGRTSGASTTPSVGASRPVSRIPSLMPCRRRQEHHVHV